jgi:hypothetical protein
LHRVSSSLALLLVLAAAAAAPGPATAVGTVDLSWNACNPVAPGPVTLFASVVGQDQAHKSYQVRLYIDAYPLAFPDAWRFDAAGCQGSSFIEIRHLPPAAVAKACPAMQGAVPGLQVKDYSYNALTGQAYCLLANSYPAGVLSPNPATRYFLMAVVLDHTYSVTGAGTPGVTCGGFEKDVTIDFDSGCIGRFCGPDLPRWLDMDGNEHEFAVGQGSLTFCGSCEPVPASATTWGSIKGQYRR